MAIMDELTEQISIHALREEGDLSVLQALEWREIFLSTPSARRATRRHPTDVRQHGISIHALREEGDRVIPPLAG